MCDRLETRIVSTLTTGSAELVEPASLRKGNDMPVLLGAIGIIYFVQLYLVSQKAAYTWWRLQASNAHIQLL